MTNRPRLPVSVATVATLATLTIEGLAVEIVVGPGQSIQAAIDDPATLDGDVITVAPGTYVETISFGGKAITLRGAEGPDATVIDAMGAGSVVTFIGEGPDSVLEGFTITGGDGFQGGGVWNILGSPTIRGCVFRGNNAIFDGGGIYNEAGAPTIIDCAFIANTAFFGGGVANVLAQPSIINCLFTGNVASPENGGHGGAIDCLASSDAFILNCTITNNVAASGAGVSSSNSAPAITNTVIWGNAANVAPFEVSTSGSSGPVFVHSLVAGSGGSDAWDDTLGLDVGGNIDADPMFAAPSGLDGLPGTDDDDLRPAAGSPLIDAGDSPIVPPDITSDLAGETRIVDDPDTVNTGIGFFVVDLGAYEFQPEEDDDGDDDDGGVGEVLELPLDVRPRHCPNVVRSRGNLWASIRGVEILDAETIDLETLVLRREDGVGGTIAPSKAYRRLRDTDGFPDVDCDCDRTRRRDGHPDLFMRWSGRRVFEVLQLDDVEPGDDVKLVVEGLLLDGTPFTSHDCVEIGRKHTRRGLGQQRAR